MIFAPWPDVVTPLVFTRLEPKWLASQGMLLQGFTVHSRDAADRTGMACCLPALRPRENRQASVNVNSLIARNLLRPCSITLLLSFRWIRFHYDWTRLKRLASKMDFKWKRIWICSEFDAFMFVNCSIGISKDRWWRRRSVYSFFFFPLQFRSNTTNAFRLFSTRSNFPVLTGLRRIFSFTWSCEIFETAAKLRETAAAIERWKLRKTSNSIETDSGTQSYKRNFEIWSQCFESASRVCSKME